MVNGYRLSTSLYSNSELILQSSILKLTLNVPRIRPVWDYDVWIRNGDTKDMPWIGRGIDFTHKNKDQIQYNTNVLPVLNYLVFICYKLWRAWFILSIVNIIIFSYNCFSCFCTFGVNICELSFLLSHLKGEVIQK